MRYIVKVGMISDDEGYAYSIWIETEYRAVIDMWSDYLRVDKTEDIYSSIVKELFRKLIRIIREDSEVIIYTDNDGLGEFINNLLRREIFIETVGKEINYKVIINVKKSVFDKDDRVYSLARMALKVKGRYPPIL